MPIPADGGGPKDGARIMSKRHSFHPTTVDGLEARIALSTVGAAPAAPAETAKPTGHQQQPTQKVEHHSHHHVSIHWGHHHHSGHHTK